MEKRLIEIIIYNFEERKIVQNYEIFSCITGKWWYMFFQKVSYPGIMSFGYWKLLKYLQKNPPNFFRDTMAFHEIWYWWILAVSAVLYFFDVKTRPGGLDGLPKAGQLSGLPREKANKLVFQLPVSGPIAHWEGAHFNFQESKVVVRQAEQMCSVSILASCLKKKKSKLSGRWF